MSWGQSNGFPNQLQILGWALDTDGSAIQAGQTTATPEPGTFGLALLAAGAAGVLAWRKRKKVA